MLILNNLFGKQKKYSTNNTISFLPKENKNSNEKAYNFQGKVIQTIYVNEFGFYFEFSDDTSFEHSDNNLSYKEFFQSNSEPKRKINKIRSNNPKLNECKKIDLSIATLQEKLQLEDIYFDIEGKTIKSFCLYEKNFTIHFTDNTTCRTFGNTFSYDGDYTHTIREYEDLLFSENENIAPLEEIFKSYKPPVTKKFNQNNVVSLTKM